MTNAVHKSGRKMKVQGVLVECFVREGAAEDMCIGDSVGECVL